MSESDSISFSRLFWSSLRSIGVISSNPCRTCLAATVNQQVQTRSLNEQNKSSQFVTNKSHLKQLSASLTSALINPVDTSFHQTAQESLQKPTIEANSNCL